MGHYVFLNIGVKEIVYEEKINQTFKKFLNHYWASEVGKFHVTLRLEQKESLVTRCWQA